MGGGATVHQFGRSKVVGAWGVDQVRQRFLTSGWKVDDVQDDRFFQGLDVDLLVQSPRGLVWLVEVKADQYTNGRVYIEEVCDATRGTPGCLVYTVSDYVAYYWVNLGVAAMLPTPVLQQWMKQHLHEYERKTVRNQVRGEQYVSYGRAVPLAALPDYYLVRDLPKYAGVS